MPALTLADLQALLGGSIRGDKSKTITGAASLEHARPDQLSFIVSLKYLPQAKASAAGVLIVPESLAESLEADCLAVDNPHGAFARALEALYPEPRLPEGIHPTATVAPDARIGAGASIGPGAVVASGAVIGAGTSIGSLSHIGPGASVGERCLLHPRVTVQHGCQVGDRVILHPGCVIGADGFGLAWEVTTEAQGTLPLQSIGTYGHGGAFGTYGWVDPAKHLVGVFLTQGGTADARNAFVAMAGASVEP